eukprot:3619650-Pyramimonas_sp.AAC.1
MSEIQVSSAELSWSFPHLSRVNLPFSFSSASLSSGMNGGSSLVPGAGVGGGGALRSVLDRASPPPM